MTGEPITEQAMQQIFTQARTHNGWLDRPVGDDLLKKIHDLMKFGPTSANSCPLRIVFVKSNPAKEKLKAALSAGNIEKTMAAPVTAIFAHDMKFYDHLPKLFPHEDARSWFAGNDALIAETAFRNGSLQAAYFIIAARALGLDCGPMSGFDQAKVNEAFFKGTSYKSNFICNLGYGDVRELNLRNPRFNFEEVCTIA